MAKGSVKRTGRRMVTHLVRFAGPRIFATGSKNDREFHEISRSGPICEGVTRFLGPASRRATTAALGG
jgi:hypothetical protein